MLSEDFFSLFISRKGFIFPWDRITDIVISVHVYSWEVGLWVKRLMVQKAYAYTLAKGTDLHSQRQRRLRSVGWLGWHWHDYACPGTSCTALVHITSLLGITLGLLNRVKHSLQMVKIIITRLQFLESTRVQMLAQMLPSCCFFYHMQTI